MFSYNNSRFNRFKRRYGDFLIEIIESDEIPEDKFLSSDLNYSSGYNNYLREKIIVAGYPIDKKYEGRHISSGEIIGIINEFELKHNADTKIG